MAAKRLTQPLKWHGGKHYLAPKIIELMPPHTHYVEPYAGGLSVLLAKDPEGISEVVNDVDGLLTNFWEVLSRPDEFQLFLRRAQGTPFSEELFLTANVVCEAFINDRLDSTQFDSYAEENTWIAWQFFIKMRQSRQGLGKDFATLSRNRTRRGMNEQVSSWLTAIDGLPEIHQRMQRVVIFNREAIDVIKSQDGPKTLFYLDPPYLQETRAVKDAFAHEMTPEQHADLLARLAFIDGRFILSGYRSELYDHHAFENKWHRVDIEIDNKASSKAEKPKVTECLWMNFKPPGKQRKPARKK